MAQSATKEPQACRACGRPLPIQRGRGRKREYCDATCRSTARRQRNRADVNVNQKLTPLRGSGKPEIVMESSDPVISEVRGAADRVVAELAEPTGGTLAGVTAARDLSAAAAAALQAAVDRARAAGRSWKEIGDVLDTTRQAAFQRFGRPVDPRTGAPMSRDTLPGAADKAVAIFTAITAGRWDEALQELTDRMRKDLSADRLAAGWAQTIGMIGGFERMDEPLVYPHDQHTVVDIPLHFEAGDRTGRVALDSDGKVAGLFIRPAAQ